MDATTSTAQGPTAYVYEGMWTNYAKGRARGLTLTLDPVHANFLIAALSLFVTMAGGQLWTIVRFTIHQSRANPRSLNQSTLHDRQQLVLRNVTTDLASARLFLCLAWAWRKCPVRPFASSYLVVLVALTHAILFMLAGTFSSTLATAEQQTVLSRSPYCGVLKQSYLDDNNGINASTTELFQQSIEFITKLESDIQLSLQYARECYATTDENDTSSNCNTFQKPYINYTMRTDGACPFNPSVCLDNIETVVFDTGHIDSRDDLGVNSDESGRLSYRRVTNCTVINDKNFTTSWVNQSEIAGQQIAYARFGPSLLFEQQDTYSYPNYASFFTAFTPSTTTPYEINSQISYAGNATAGADSFDPVPELKQTVGDLNLIFLSYTGRYIVPIDDPWFSAHKLVFFDTRSPIARKTYVKDRPISTLGCVEQHQVCTPHGSCTPLLGFRQVQEAIDDSTIFSANQLAVINRIIGALELSLMSVVIEGLASGSTPVLALALAATESHTLSLGLPNTQWQNEVNFWHSISMAHLQRLFVEYGTGQIAAQTKYLQLPQTSSDRWICQNLMIRGTSYQSYSVLALSLLIGFGISIVVLSFFIETIASYVQTRWNGGAMRRKIWDSHDILVLHTIKRSSQQIPFFKNGQSTAPPNQDRVPGKVDERTPLTTHEPFHQEGSFESDKKQHLNCYETENYHGASLEKTWYIGDDAYSPNGTLQMKLGRAITTGEEGFQSSCSACGVSGSLRWHSARLGEGWWCERCLAGHNLFHEGSVAAVRNAAWI